MSDRTRTPLRRTEEQIKHLLREQVAEVASLLEVLDKLKAGEL